MSEYGRRCGSCFRYRRCRLYWRPVFGVSGKLAEHKRWRKLCEECWELAEGGRLVPVSIMRSLKILPRREERQ